MGERVGAGSGRAGSLGPALFAVGLGEHQAAHRAGLIAVPCHGPWWQPRHGLVHRAGLARA